MTIRSTAPDVGGSFAGLVLQFDIVRAEDPINGEEDVLYTERLENLYPGAPIHLKNFARWPSRRGSKLVGRLTVIEGDGSVLGDLALLLKMRRTTPQESLNQ